ncbi:MAG: ribose 5-phosphate isomerase A, partial [Pseudomonadales bacterium]|nr:ribose 5-phosphate isomerase A [Pseudomonadales bacterium]
MKSQDELKQAAAGAAFAYVRERLEERTVIGIGTGSTADRFIDLLAGLRARINATVASSEAS